MENEYESSYEIPNILRLFHFNDILLNTQAENLESALRINYWLRNIIN